MKKAFSLTASQGNRWFQRIRPGRSGLAGDDPGSTRQAVKSAFRLATRAIDFSIAGPDKVFSRRLCSTYSAMAAISCS